MIVNVVRDFFKDEVSSSSDSNEENKKEDDEPSDDDNANDALIPMSRCHFYLHVLWSFAINFTYPIFLDCE